MLTGMNQPRSAAVDARGRPRSPVTLPEFRRGRVPLNKGRKLPAEALTHSEMHVLMDSFSHTSATGLRNRAMVWLMYRLQMKVGEVVAMERRHYDAGSDRLTLPASRRGPERQVQLDSGSRDALDQWLDARGQLEIRPAAPLFCTTETEWRGRPLRPAYVREMLSRKARNLHIDKCVTPEGLRASWAHHQATATAGVERQIEAYVDDHRFRLRYPLAHAKWRDAYDLYLLDAERHATRIGHDCREAMLAFADELVRLHLTTVPASAGVIDKLRSVLRSQHGVSDTVRRHLDALLPYWGTVWDLANRHEHGALREKESLRAEDTRRLAFQTVLVIYEIDRALLRHRAPSPDPRLRVAALRRALPQPLFEHLAGEADVAADAQARHAVVRTAS
jgi:hypothetical protein